MEINLNSPALLFPAISLLLLAYTNRFLALASLIRTLHNTYKTQPDALLLAQIANLRHRVVLIRNMQWAGVFSILLCVFCMFLLFEGWVGAAKIIFAVSLFSLMASLIMSLREIQISMHSLSLLLSDIEQELKHHDPASH